MLITNAIFERKIDALRTKPCVIEAIEVMSSEEYENFKSNLLSDRAFIADRKEDMFTDSSGKIHCLLAMNEESGDGILIDSSGYDYARYVSFMPNIKAYIEQKISLAADKIIRNAAENTSNGSWTVSFEESSEQFGITVKENSGIGSMLLSELESRKEMAEIIVEDGCFDMVLYLDYCKNLEQSSMNQNMGI
ncbi:MAG: DUF6329 domain-containing protein [Ruminiclostridium sp.]